MRIIKACSLAVLFLVGGCAVGVTHNYVQDTLNIHLSTTNSIAVGTLDHRPYVLTSRKDENFVGLSRGGFGNPFNVVTASGNPLADDISRSIASSLKKGGVDAQVVKLLPNLTSDQARESLTRQKKRRSVLLVLREWKGDAMMQVSFNYEFDISIFDNNGVELFRKQVKAKENLGQSDAFSPGGGRQVGARFRSLMENLFQDPEVRKNLE